MSRIGRVLLGAIRFLAGALDRLDECRARGRRAAFGRRLWLLSWHREPDGRWRARLSGPETVRTIERSAPTRSRAIARSVRALKRLPRWRARLGRRPGDTPPTDPSSPGLTDIPRL